MKYQLVVFDMAGTTVRDEGLVARALIDAHAVVVDAYPGRHVAPGRAAAPNSTFATNIRPIN